MDFTDLTIAIATYNGQRHVRPAIASALATGARVVVSDDNSTDDTLSMIQAFGEQVVLLQHTSNLGIGRHYQYLLEACATPLLMLLNQDDILIADRVRRVPVTPSVITVINGWIIDERDRRLRLIYRRPPFHATARGTYAGLSDANFIKSPSQVIFPVDRARAVGGFVMAGDAGQGAEDWMCWLRMAADGVGFRLRLRPAMGYRVHAGNYSHNHAALAASMESVRSQAPAPPRRDRRLVTRA